MLDTFCILSFDGLKRESVVECECYILHWHAIKYRMWPWFDSLAELGVDREDLWVANKGESKDGNGVSCLCGTHKHVISIAADCLEVRLVSATADICDLNMWKQSKQPDCGFSSPAYLWVHGEHVCGAVGVIILMNPSVTVLMAIARYIQAVSSCAVHWVLLKWAGNLKLLKDNLYLKKKEKQQGYKQIT